MSEFKAALAVLLKAEGPGGSIPRDDPGGLTVFGITRMYEKNWPGWTRFDALYHGQARPSMNGVPCTWEKDAELNLLVSDHYEHIWDSMQLGNIKSQVVANAVLGAYVNEGPKVVRWLQAAAGTYADGVMGPNTIDAVNAAPCVWEKFSIQRLRHYNDTAEPEYLHGLFARVLEVGA